MFCLYILHRIQIIQLKHTIEQLTYKLIHEIIFRTKIEFYYVQCHDKLITRLQKVTLPMNKNKNSFEMFSIMF